MRLYTRDRVRRPRMHAWICRIIQRMRPVMREGFEAQKLARSRGSRLSVQISQALAVIIASASEGLAQKAPPGPR